jgi:hypothetical protein
MTSAQTWEQAAPDYDGPNLGAREGAVTWNGTDGPGILPSARDEWMGISIFDVGHNGVEDGRQNFALNPAVEPPEGHQGFDFPDEDQIQNRSTRHIAIFWSDFWGSTAANGMGAGSFTGQHVVISRIPPGSRQGYMPSDPGIEQYNTVRNNPGPWDAGLTVGSQNMGAAVSM